jgi:hypothetical protein
MTAYFFLAALVGSMAALVFMAVRRRGSRIKLHAEYWVYLPGEKLPSQDEAMTMVLQGTSAVGPSEGALFSDVRLHVALGLRTRNPHAFRPDLFEDYIEPTAEQLEALAESHSLVKIRFVADRESSERRHLSLLPYLAYAYAKLGSAQVLFDPVAERLLSMSEFKTLLQQHPSAVDAEVHVNVLCRSSQGSLRAETRGMAKVGLPDLISREISADQQVLASHILEEAAAAVWELPKLPERLAVECFEDPFELLIAPASDGRAEVTILRIHPA